MSPGAVESSTSTPAPTPAPARAGGAAGSSRPLDARALTRHAQRLAAQPVAPWLHAEVARRMAERLAILKRAPERVVDWGAEFGASEGALRQACPRAERRAVAVWAGPSVQPQPSADPLPWWSARRWWPAGQGVASPTHESELAAGAADLLWSNMVLHHLPDPGAAFARWLRLLAVDGILMFSTLGPGSLASLRRLYATRGWPSPHAPFVDMHDLGDMLVRAGFADPVMDQEVLHLTWGSPHEALVELRQLGGNADLGRHRGLRTARWRRQLEQALMSTGAQAGTPSGADGRVELEFEVVYGHAVRPAPRVALAAETSLPLDDLRGMLRRRGAGPGGSRAPTR